MRYSHTCLIRVKTKDFQHIVKVLKRIAFFCLQSIQSSCGRAFTCYIRNRSNSRAIFDNINSFTLCVIIIEVAETIPFAPYTGYVPCSQTSLSCRVEELHSKHSDIRIFGLLLRAIFCAIPLIRDYYMQITQLILKYEQYLASKFSN